MIVGSVNLSSSASIWYSSTLRGDVQPIKVGQNSLLQDLVTVLPKKNAVHIGSNVVVAPNSFLEGCQIEDGAFIGMGSTVREGAKIEKWGVVAAGAVVGEKQVVPSNQVKRDYYFSFFQFYSGFDFLVKLTVSMFALAKRLLLIF